MKYTWNEDTLDHFKFIANHDTKGKVVQEITEWFQCFCVLYEITEFVENNCQLEDNEVYQDLIDDLVAQVYTER
jgi:thiaminase